MSKGEANMDNGHPPTDTPRSQNQWSDGLARSARRPRGSSRGFLLVAVAIVFGLMTAGLSLAVFSTPGSNRTGGLSSAGNNASVVTGPSSATSRAPATAAPSGRAPAHPRPAPAKPKAAGRPAAEAVLTWPATLGHQMTHWAAGPGGATLGRLESELGVAMQTAGLKLFVQMRQACGTLAADTSAARSGPPIPDHVIEGSYIQALAGLSQAASHCQMAISVRPDGDETTQTRLNEPLLSQARAELAVASKQLYQATSRVSSLHR